MCSDVYLAVEDDFLAIFFATDILGTLSKSKQTIVETIFESKLTTMIVFFAFNVSRCTTNPKLILKRSNIVEFINRKLIIRKQLNWTLSKYHNYKSMQRNCWENSGMSSKMFSTFKTVTWLNSQVILPHCHRYKCYVTLTIIHGNFTP